MGDRFASLRVAAVQASPVVLEREATLERALLWVRRLLVADLELGEVVRGRQLLEVVGHYSRPDVFREP